MAGLAAQFLLTRRAKALGKKKIKEDLRKFGVGGVSTQDEDDDVESNNNPGFERLGPGAAAAAAALDKKLGPGSAAAAASVAGSFLVPPPEESARSAGERLKQAPVETLLVLSTTIRLVTSVTSFVAQFTAIVLLTFVVHQLFIWIDKDPEAAFDQAAVLLEVTEIVWDTFAILTNAVVDVSNAALIPTWNAWSFYVIEPVVILTLEVFSLLFLGQDYNGIIDESDFPYAGLDCTSTTMAAAWCGRYSFYEAKLRAEHEGSYINSSLVIGTATARRLSELSGDADTFVTPAFEMENVTVALNELATLAITLSAPLADIGVSALDEIFITSAQLIFDLFFFLLRNLFEVARWLVKSGLLSTLITIGVDFFVSCRPCPCRSK